jgi:hypothetical protein
MTDTNPRDLHPMTNQIPIEEALELVQFKQAPNGSWYVENVKGDVYGSVGGNVWGNINGCVWQFVETPKEKLTRLIQEGADKAQPLEAINQLEESSG